MNTKLFKLVVVAVGLVISPQHSRAEPAADKQSRASLAMNESASSSVSDVHNARDVAALMHQINKHEIAMGRLGEQRAAAPAIKNYAKMILQNHITADDKLLEITRRRKLDLAASRVGPDDEDSMMELEQLSGEPFDAAFLRYMHLAHSNAVSEFSAAQVSLPPGELRTFISDQIPMFAAHENTAVQLQKSLRQAETSNME